MKKINRIFNAISISILALILIGLSGTFLSDYLVSINWFDDFSKIESKYGGKEMEYFYWGTRHYWYNWGLFFLFLTAFGRSVANVVMIIEDKK